MCVLGIETSCDETGLALVGEGGELLAHELHSQVDLHALYGGVVPELASRDHSQRLLPLLKQVLKKAEVRMTDLQGIAYTAGPGLVGALLVGASFAKALGFALSIPSIGVHHMEGHLLAALLEDPNIQFPFLGLLVSGGHTLLVDVKDIGHYQILGESLDDAAGEAFDKIAKLLGLGYPGGPSLSKLAESGNPTRFHFPRPLTNKPGFDFSFSGLKTAALYALKATENSSDFTDSTDTTKKTTEIDRADIAAAFQEAVIDTLFIKCKRALEFTQYSHLVIAGGVGANTLLRSRFSELEKRGGYQLRYPRPEFCTDNGAMIAFAGYHRLKRGQSESLSIQVHPRWSMEAIGLPS